ncbi:hypothetical protein [Desulfoluna sp.]|uniref:hypothetical protein n=1 Tax=Desulfoluna sp. TaxID=2045199 RepID=UPI0026127BFD|nr:hypothetical protein [Desulfoluna sp.]
MRITQDDKKILRVEEKNRTIVLIAGIIMSFALVRTGFLIYTFGLAYESYLHWIFLAVIAGIAGNSFIEEVDFTFHRIKQEIFWSRKKLFRKEKAGRLSFSDVEDVRLGYRGKGKLAKYRIEFIVKGESLPLSPVYFQGARAKENCNSIAGRILETISKG